MCKEKQQDQNVEGSDKDTRETLNGMRQVLDYVAFEFMWDEEKTDQRYLAVEKLIRGLNENKERREIVAQILAENES